MATVKGLCSSSLAPSSSSSSSQRSLISPASSSHASRFSSSSSRLNVLYNAEPVRHSRRNSRLVTFAVLAEPKIKVTSPSITRTNEPEVAGIATADSQILELASTSHLQAKLQSPAKATPRNKSPVLGLTDTSLKSTLEHRLWVAFGGAMVTGMMTKALIASHSPEGYLEVAVGVASAWVLADLGTGFYHWGVDNYGNAKTPVFGSQIDAFQGHHQRPWTITKREFANNIHAIARPAGLFLSPFLLTPNQPFFDSFLGLFLGFVVMSQQFHAFSHMKKSQLPPFVVALQDSGFLLSRKMHGTHHKPPYDVNYTIVSGLWNPILNETQVFKKLERYIYEKWGVAPRAWSDTSEEWMQTDSYFEDGTEFDPSQSS
ncbi:fatty acid desaturase 4-like 1, chloroplastic [Physcomitrium patens]|uniref:Lipid desaturase domain-containing protein n=1 Tax=Physcomitrium patens TaxID=3218 RepID=A0A2K1JLN8_PHYPA|nr:fatty acid desaturase 4-like 1, chloroplastic [Physcomitrium patens]PNR42457.1 hypothetical protein PHYPA_017287 [Physcomitrium patens]|eukprot:XP_024392231.1 fatty acid desaturase 4-like 1, chloroplastic [Physcomitrella patens]